MVKTRSRRGLCSPAFDTPRDPEVSAAVTRALAEGRALHLTYVGAIDERTDRDVDPMRVLTLEGRTYLEAWCRRAEAVRTFRLDRIEQAVVLPEPAVVPDDAAPVDLGSGTLRPEGAPVTLELAPEVAWIAEEHPVESVTELGDGRLRVVMPVADERWLVRLLLRMGSSVTVVDRPDLAERVPRPEPRWRPTPRPPEPIGVRLRRDLCSLNAQEPPRVVPTPAVSVRNTRPGGGSDGHHQGDLSDVR